MYPRSGIVMATYTDLSVRTFGIDIDPYQLVRKFAVELGEELPSRRGSASECSVGE